MTRILAPAVLLLAAAGCTPDPVFCEGETQFKSAFPDDFFTEPDDTTSTGLRVHIDEHNAPWIEDQMPLSLALYEDSSALDGFGTSAGVVLRFSGPVSAFPSGAEASLASNSVIFVELGDDGPRRVPFEVRPSDEDATMIVWPLRPLRPKTQHAVVVTRDASDADGSCISPSPALRSFLADKDVGNAQKSLPPRYKALLSELKITPDDVSAATVFTTGTVTDASMKVAKDVARKSFEWKNAPTCTDVESEPYLACTGSFMAGNYTKNEVYVDGTVQSTYEIPVALWLPKTGNAPFPVLVYGHQLAADKEEGASFAARNARLGLATVAIDAVKHGAHPTGSGNPVSATLELFGIDSGAMTLNPFALRDNLRTSTWDKLQLIRLISEHSDVDGVALDTSRMAYAGYSLGGIMGSELLSLTDAFDAAILVVAGARLSSIVSAPGYVSTFINGFPGAPKDPEDAFPPLLQALIDAGDPVNYAPHVLRNRFDLAGDKPPHLLLTAVIDDLTVPNESNYALARALGTPHLAPVIEPVELLDVVAEGPVVGNMPGNRTAAFFQFDRTSNGSGGDVKAAVHGSIFSRPEPQLQMTRFLETWLNDDAPEVIDPYVAMGTPPLP